MLLVMRKLVCFGSVVPIVPNSKKANLPEELMLVVEVKLMMLLMGCCYYLLKMRKNFLEYLHLLSGYYKRRVVGSIG